MKQHRQQIVEAIHARTATITDRKLLAQEIAAYLLSENRVAELEPLLRDLINYRIGLGTVEATVVSAHELSSEVVSDIKKILAEEFENAKTISVNSKLNPDVVGGIRVVLPQEQLDLTLRSKLSAFKSHIQMGKG